LSSAERRIALRAAKALGLGIAGVDLLRSARGPLVLEVNASPGLEGIEAVTGVDVADAVVAQIEGTLDCGRRVRDV
jgi:ribosomal protein S6--L-glutamate ligase